jgi:hypothetical protein
MNYIIGEREVIFKKINQLLEYGVFGDGNNKSLKTPKLNDYFTYLSKE